MRRRLLPGGMVKLELVLEPDEADLVLRAVDRAREVHAEQAAQPDRSPDEAGDVSAETPWPSRADGMVKLAESFLAGHPVTGTGGERFQVMVHLDQEVLGPDGAWQAPWRMARAFPRKRCGGWPAIAAWSPYMTTGRR